MIKIAVIDDDSFYLDALMSHCNRFSEVKKINVEIVGFSSALEYLGQERPLYDIYFLDIDMPHMNGMELAKAIRKTDQHALIVFVTNMPQFAVQGYEVNAFDYLIKPVSYDLFERKMEWMLNALKENDEISLLIPEGEIQHRVKSSEILFIEVQDHWLFIHSKDHKYELLGTLSDMEERLSQANFIRCSKSCLINLQHVTRMRSYIVVINGEYELKISRARRKEVQFAFIDYYSKCHRP